MKKYFLKTDVQRYRTEIDLFAKSFREGAGVGEYLQYLSKWNRNVLLGDEVQVEGGSRVVPTVTVNNELITSFIRAKRFSEIYVYICSVFSTRSKGFTRRKVLHENLCVMTGYSYKRILAIE